MHAKPHPVRLLAVGTLREQPWSLPTVEGDSAAASAMSTCERQASVSNLEAVLQRMLQRHITAVPDATWQ
jgi:hypothetical protein